MSIIVPVYNNGKYVGECIESILNQTYKNIELILVDDGSLDDSLDVCKKYEGEKVIVIDKENQGVSATRNRGIEEAHGDYIAFVDSDDTIETDAIEKLIRTMFDYDVDLVAAKFNFLYSDGRKLKHAGRMISKKYYYDELIPDFLDDGTLSGVLIGSSCSALYKASIIKPYGIRFNTDLSMNEDGLFNYEYFIHSKSLYYLDEYLYNARKHSTNSTSKRRLSYDFNTILCNYVSEKYKTMRELNLECQFRRRTVTFALWNILACRKEMNFCQCYQYIRGLVSNSTFRNNLHLIQKDKLKSHKKVMFVLMQKKASLLLAVTTKWVIPFLSSKVAR